MPKAALCACPPSRCAPGWPPCWSWWASAGSIFRSQPAPVALEALRASAALGEGAVWQGAASLQALVQKLQGASPIAEVPCLPACMPACARTSSRVELAAVLRAQGLGGILADDMGLGKRCRPWPTSRSKDAGRLTAPALVIAPVSLMGNWHSEAARFCPGLRTLVLHGAGRHELADSVAEHDLVIAPYSLLQRDRERWLQLQWHLVVLDEAQNIKTPAPTWRRWCLHCRRGTGCACRARPWKTTWARSGACSTF